MWNSDDILNVIYAMDYVMLHLLQFHLEEMADPRLRGILSVCILLTYVFYRHHVDFSDWLQHQLENVSRVGSWHCTDRPCGL